MKRSFLTIFFLTLTLGSEMAWAQSQAAAPSEDGQMNQVEAIMQRAHETQQQVQQQQAAEKAGANFMQNIIKSSTSNSQQKLVTGGSPAAVAAPIQKVGPNAKNAQGSSATSTLPVQQLKAQLVQLNQENASFQQQTDQRIDVLNQEHTLLQSRLTQLSQVLAVLNQEVTQLNQQITSAQKQLAGAAPLAGSTKLSSLSAGFTQNIENSKTTQYVLYAILVLLVIVIMMLIPRRRAYKIDTVAASASSAAAANELSENDTQDEYDFMNSSEAIPAKLDLARAYMAMEDYKSARKVLEQVCKIGNEAQQTEAKKMLGKIPQ